MRLTPIAAVLAATVLILTACGGDDDSEKKSSQPEVADLPAHEGMAEDKKVQLKRMCEALSDAEVSEALGEDVTRGQTVRNNCMFTDLSDLQPSVTIVAQPLNAIGGIEALKSALAPTDGQGLDEVDDIGDEAYIRVDEDDDGARATAAMVVRESYLQLQVTLSSGADADETRETAVGLLQLVDSRLPEASADQSD